MKMASVDATQQAKELEPCGTSLGPGQPGTPSPECQSSHSSVHTRVHRAPDRLELTGPGMTRRPRGLEPTSIEPQELDGNRAHSGHGVWLTWNPQRTQVMATLAQSDRELTGLGDVAPRTKP